MTLKPLLTFLWADINVMSSVCLCEPHEVQQGQVQDPCYQYRLGDEGITESQNGRGWKGPLWVIWSNPPAEAGSPTVGCRGPCPGGS